MMLGDINPKTLELGKGGRIQAVKTINQTTVVTLQRRHMMQSDINPKTLELGRGKDFRLSELSTKQQRLPTSAGT